jgi:hypothetical protein
MVVIDEHYISRVSSRAISQTALAGLGLMTGVLLTLLVALAIWLIYQRRYGMFFEKSSSLFSG